MSQRLSARPLLVTLPLLLVWFSRPLAGALVEYDIARLAEKSSHIVCGKVLSVRGYWGRFGELAPVILTEVTIEVEERWKGAPERTITLHVLGGQVGDAWQWCPESPSFEVGEEALVFARPWKGKLWTTGWVQGKYRISRDPAGVRRIQAREHLPLRHHRELSSVKAEVEGLLRARAVLEGRAGGTLPPGEAVDDSAPSGSQPSAAPRETAEPQGGTP